MIGGTLHVQMQDGSVIEAGPNEVFDIPPGHDGWAVGDVPFVSVNWAGFHSWVPERAGGRILLTLLFTDIVRSTERAVALGDSAWAQLLASHYRAMRVVVDRYRGREVNTSGDGFLVAFDGAGRAIEAAIAIRDRARADGLSIRAGVHSGEVEIAGSDLRGVTVHEAARIAATAGTDEILVSEGTRLLAAGPSFEFESRGQFELKGLPGVPKPVRGQPGEQVWPQPDGDHLRLGSRRGAGPRRGRSDRLPELPQPGLPARDPVE